MLGRLPLVVRQCKGNVTITGTHLYGPDAQALAAFRAPSNAWDDSWGDGTTRAVQLVRAGLRVTCVCLLGKEDAPLFSLSCLRRVAAAVTSNHSVTKLVIELVLGREERMEAYAILQQLARDAPHLRTLVVYGCNKYRGSGGTDEAHDEAAGDLYVDLMAHPSVRTFGGDFCVYGMHAMRRMLEAVRTTTMRSVWVPAYHGRLRHAREATRLTLEVLQNPCIQRARFSRGIDADALLAGLRLNTNVCKVHHPDAPFFNTQCSLDRRRDWATRAALEEMPVPRAWPTVLFHLVRTYIESRPLLDERPL